MVRNIPPPTILTLDREAAEHYVDWWNTFVDKNNKITNDSQVKSREMKFTTNVARLALIIQVARYACGESHLQYIDARSIDAAIRLNDYFEDSLSRVQTALDADESQLMPAKKEKFFSMLPDAFNTSFAIGLMPELKVCKRTIQNWLKEFIVEGKLYSPKQSEYEKVKPADPRITTEGDSEHSNPSAVSETGSKD